MKKESLLLISSIFSVFISASIFYMTCKMIVEIGDLEKALQECRANEVHK